MTYRSAVTPGSRRSVLSGAIVAGLLLPLAACSTTTTCVDWVSYATPQDAYDDADLVVLGTPGPVTGGADMFGLRVPVHGFDVEDVLKGTSPADLSVAQAPVTCSAEGGEDALADGGRVVLFLVRESGVYRTLTPSTGILPLDEGEPLPFSRD